MGDLRLEANTLVHSSYLGQSGVKSDSKHNSDTLGIGYCDYQSTLTLRLLSVLVQMYVVTVFGHSIRYLLYLTKWHILGSRDIVTLSQQVFKNSFQQGFQLMDYIYN